MNLDEPEERDVAAAEYVTGTLVGEDRAAFEARLDVDPALVRTVYDWQDRLLGLARRAPPIDPDARLWTRIEGRLDPRASGAMGGTVPGAVTSAANASFWNRLGTWRAATGAALAAAVLLAVALTARGPTDAVRYLAVLQSPLQKTAGWVVEGTARDGVRLVPLAGAAAPVAAPAGKVLQFWTKPDGARGPTSLGLVDATRVAVVPIDRLPGLGDRQLFEVTLEPAGGSTIGKPTGPVLYVGSTVHL